MDNTSYIALSRQMALWKQMNIVSNNVANMNTAGYKQDNALFTSYINQTPDAAGVGAAPQFFTMDFGDFQDFGEGAFKNTGNTFDLAIKGETAVLLTSPAIRPFVRSIIERFRPLTVVMSQNEIHPKAKIKTVGQI